MIVEFGINQWRSQTLKKWTQTKYFYVISGQLVVIYQD
jgi:hypothetical protein